jgi:hypothetical protein
MATDNKFFSFGRVSVQNSLYVNGNTSVQNGRLTVGDNSTDASIVAQGSGSIIVPVGSSFERPASAITGMVRFNSSTNSLEFWNPNPGTWTGVVSATGGDYNLDTVKFDLTDDQLTDFSSLEASFLPTSDILPDNVVYRNSWVYRTTPADSRLWTSVAFGTYPSTSSPGTLVNILVAVASSGTGQRVMTSFNGTGAGTGNEWTLRTSAADEDWSSVAWAGELGLFVAVATSGTGNRVMTSSDGIDWVGRASAADEDWSSVAWASELGLLVAVATSGTGNRVMTSPDGIVWTSQTSAADNDWRSVVWAGELDLFVAVASSGTGDRVMTSPDGIVWTVQSSAANNNWRSVAWSSELGILVAVADSGTGNRIMTSYDGINWVTRTSPANIAWSSVAWAASKGIFMAVATGTQVMLSSNGIQWSLGNAVALQEWSSVVWAPAFNLFVSVSLDGSPVPGQVMTNTVPEDSKYGGACLSKNNDVYFTPSSAHNILVYDTIDRSTRTIDITTIDPSFNSTNKWIGACITPTDLFVAAPFTSTNILLINAADSDVVSLLPIPSDILSDVTASANKWTGCTTTPVNTLVYFTPASARRIMTLDYTTLAVSSILLPDDIKNIAGTKFNTAVLGADRNIYMFPRDLDPPTNPTVILKIDTVSNTLTLLPHTFPPNENPNPAQVFKNMWFGGVLAPDRKIYVTPLGNRNVLEYDPATNVLIAYQLPLSPLVDFSRLNWVNAALGQNGKVYAFPFVSGAILEFDPVTKTANYIPLPFPGRFRSTTKFFGAVMGPDNSLYAVPRTENVMMELSFLKGTAYKSWMLSSYFNRC